MSALDAAIAVTRFGLGARPGEIAAATGDPRGWLLRQVGQAPQLAVGPGSQDILRDFTTRYRDAVRTAQSGEGGDAEAAEREARRLIREPRITHTLARTELGMTTAAGFAERWVRFWSNHFSVGPNSPQAAAVGPTLEAEVIRAYAFGRFDALVIAAETHPAMLLYLDQAMSVGPNSTVGRRRDRGLNENLAREILELHTVGVNGGYDQADVEALARILTGWTVGSPQLRTPENRLGQTLFVDALHEPGSQTLMGQTFQGDGPEKARAALTFLAERPETVEHCCVKLARHFFADEPDPRNVEVLVEAWRGTGGDLSAVAAALISAPSAFDPAFGKFKTPEDFLMSALRALGTRMVEPRALIASYGALGQAPFSAPSPAGWPDNEADWAGPDAVLKRLDYAAALAERTQDADPRTLAEDVLGLRLSGEARQAIARAESAEQGLTLLLMSPEFQRR